MKPTDPLHYVFASLAAAFLVCFCFACSPLADSSPAGPMLEQREAILVVSERDNKGRYVIPKCPHPACGKPMINFCVRYQCPEQHQSETKPTNLNP